MFPAGHKFQETRWIDEVGAPKRPAVMLRQVLSQVQTRPAPRQHDEYTIQSRAVLFQKLSRQAVEERGHGCGGR